MRRHDEIRCRHMLDAAPEAVPLAQGRTRNDLDNDRQLVLALVKDVEIAGEAASRITEPTRQHLSEIPWKQIVGMRIRLAHDKSSLGLGQRMPLPGSEADAVAERDTHLPVVAVPHDLVPRIRVMPWRDNRARSKGTIHMTHCGAFR